MPAQEEAAGLAALSICESLVIALVEKGVLSVEEARETLEDAAAAHHGTPPEDRAAHLIERVAAQVDAVAQLPRSGGGLGGGSGNEPGSGSGDGPGG